MPCVRQGEAGSIAEVESHTVGVAAQMRVNTHSQIGSAGDATSAEVPAKVSEDKRKSTSMAMAAAAVAAVINKLVAAAAKISGLMAATSNLGIGLAAVAARSLNLIRTLRLVLIDAPCR